MKSNLLIVILAAFVISGCEQKHTKIRNELLLIQRTTNDITQPDYIRESAVVFEKILREEKDNSKNDWITATVDVMEQNNETTISTYVSFLKAVEKKLPDKLPPVEAYQAMNDKAVKADIIEFNVARTVYLIGASMKGISLYGDPEADAEIEGILQRFKEMYGSSETGSIILKYLNMEHGQGLEECKSEHKPWHTPRRPPVYIPKGKPRQQ